VLKGSFIVGGIVLDERDGLGISTVDSFDITARTIDSEILLMEECTCNKIKALNLLGCDQLFSNFYYNYEKRVLFFILAEFRYFKCCSVINANENWFAIGASTDSEAQKLLKNIKLRLYC
jgi:hypothetical protein